jgi:hypothetical protein
MHRGANLPEENEPDQIKLTTEQKWTAYSRKMATLFAERNKYPVDSPEREAAAKAILVLWVAEGSSPTAGTLRTGKHTQIRSDVAPPDEGSLRVTERK